MAGVTMAVLLLFVCVGGGLLLYAAVAVERDRRPVMDRESAERVARRDTSAESREGDRRK